MSTSTSTTTTPNTHPFDLNQLASIFSWYDEAITPRPVSDGDAVPLAHMCAVGKLLSKDPRIYVDALKYDLCPSHCATLYIHIRSMARRIESGSSVDLLEEDTAIGELAILIDLLAANDSSLASPLYHLLRRLSPDTVRAWVSSILGVSASDFVPPLDLTRFGIEPNPGPTPFAIRWTGTPSTASIDLVDLPSFGYVEGMRVRIRVKFSSAGNPDRHGAVVVRPFGTGTGTMWVDGNTGERILAMGAGSHIIAAWPSGPAVYGDDMEHEFIYSANSRMLALALDSSGGVAIAVMIRVEEIGWYNSPSTTILNTSPIDVSLSGTSQVQVVNTAAQRVPVELDGQEVPITIVTGEDPLYVTTVKPVPAPPLVGIEENPGPNVQDRVATFVTTQPVTTVYTAEQVSVIPVLTASASMRNDGVHQTSSAAWLVRVPRGVEMPEAPEWQTSYQFDDCQVLMAFTATAGSYPSEPVPVRKIRRMNLGQGDKLALIVTSDNGTASWFVTLSLVGVETNPGPRVEPQAVKCVRGTSNFLHGWLCADSGIEVGRYEWSLEQERPLCPVCGKSDHPAAPRLASNAYPLLGKSSTQPTAASVQEVLNLPALNERLPDDIDGEEELAGGIRPPKMSLTAAASKASPSGQLHEQRYAEELGKLVGRHGSTNETRYVLFCIAHDIPLDNRYIPLLHDADTQIVRDYVDGIAEEKRATREQAEPQKPKRERSERSIKASCSGEPEDKPKKARKPKEERVFEPSDAQKRRRVELKEAVAALIAKKNAHIHRFVAFYALGVSVGARGSSDTLPQSAAEQMGLSAALTAFDPVTGTEKRTVERVFRRWLAGGYTTRGEMLLAMAQNDPTYVSDYDLMLAHDAQRMDNLCSTPTRLLDQIANAHNREMHAGNGNIDRCRSAVAAALDRPDLDAVFSQSGDYYEDVMQNYAQAFRQLSLRQEDVGYTTSYDWAEENSASIHLLTGGADPKRARHSATWARHGLRRTGLYAPSANMMTVIDNIDGNNTMQGASMFRIRTETFWGETLLNVAKSSAERYRTGNTGSNVGYYAKLLALLHTYMPMPGPELQSIAGVTLVYPDTPIYAHLNYFPLSSNDQQRALPARICNYKQFTDHLAGLAPAWPAAYSKDKWGTEVAVVPIQSGWIDSYSGFCAHTIAHLEHPFREVTFNAQLTRLDTGVAIDAGGETIYSAIHNTRIPGPTTRVLYVVVDITDTGNQFNIALPGNVDITLTRNGGNNVVGGADVDIIPALDVYIADPGRVVASVMRILNLTLPLAHRDDWRSALTFVANASHLLPWTGLYDPTAPDVNHAYNCWASYLGGTTVFPGLPAYYQVPNLNGDLDNMNLGRTNPLSLRRTTPAGVRAGSSPTPMMLAAPDPASWVDVVAGSLRATDPLKQVERITNAGVFCEINKRIVRYISAAAEIIIRDAGTSLYQLTRFATGNAPDTQLSFWLAINNAFNNFLRGTGSHSWYLDGNAYMGINMFGGWAALGPAVLGTVGYTPLNFGRLPLTYLASIGVYSWEDLPRSWAVPGMSDTELAHFNQREVFWQKSVSGLLEDKATMTRLNTYDGWVNNAQTVYVAYCKSGGSDVSPALFPAFPATAGRCRSLALSEHLPALGWDKVAIAPIPVFPYGPQYDYFRRADLHFMSYGPTAPLFQQPHTEYKMFLPSNDLVTQSNAVYTNATAHSAYEAAIRRLNGTDAKAEPESFPSAPEPESPSGMDPGATTEG